MTEDADADTHQQRRTLWIVLGLNIGLVAAFGIGGLLADSNALMANALDNASDSLVYILSLLALSQGEAWMHGAARVSGVLLLLFALAVIADAARRFHGQRSSRTHNDRHGGCRGSGECAVRLVAEPGARRRQCQGRANLQL
jgi:Co/Zn/Cd efflux system component